MASDYATFINWVEQTALPQGVHFTMVDIATKRPRDYNGAFCGWQDRHPDKHILAHVKSGGTLGIIPYSAELICFDYDPPDDGSNEIDASRILKYLSRHKVRCFIVPSRTEGRFHVWCAVHQDFVKPFNNKPVPPKWGPWEVRFDGAHTIVWHPEHWMSQVSGSKGLTNEMLEEVFPQTARQTPPTAVNSASTAQSGTGGQDTATKRTQGESAQQPADSYGTGNKWMYADEFLQALRINSRADIKEDANELRCDTPFDSASESQRFIVNKTTGVGHDWKADKTYTPAEIAKQLNVTIYTKGRTAPTNIPYDDEPPPWLDADVVIDDGLQFRQATDISARLRDKASQNGAGPREPFELFDVHTLLAWKPPPYLWEGYIPEASLSYLYGVSGSGKSLVALHIGLRVAQDGHKVLYMNFEGGPSLGKRVQAWLTHHKVEASAVENHFYAQWESLSMYIDGDADMLLGVIRTNDIKLIVLDTLSMASSGADENSNTDAALIVVNSRRITEAGCAVLYVHHEGKEAAKGLRGASRYKDSADSVLHIPNKFKDEVLDSEVVAEGVTAVKETAVRLTLTHEKMRESYTQPDHDRLIISVDGGAVCVRAPEKAEGEIKALNDKQPGWWTILKHLPLKGEEPMTSGILLAHLEELDDDVKRSAMNRWLDKLQKDGAVMRVKHGHYGLTASAADVEDIREAIRLTNAVKTKMAAKQADVPLGIAIASLHVLLRDGRVEADAFYTKWTYLGDEPDDIPM